MKRLTVTAVALALLTLPACGSDSLSKTTTAPAGGGTTGGGGSAAAPKVDQALAAKLPAKVKDAKKFVVGTDPTYAPSEMLNADGKTVEGFDVDLFNAVAAKFGVTAEFTPGAFETIIAGIDAKKYDVGVSSFTVNAARMEKNTMVSYYSAGTRWAVAQGNPKKFDPANLCGHTVAVQTGTTQEQDLLPPLQDKCGANKITINSYDSQAEATASVAAGKNEAVVADSPVIDYAVKQSGGKLEAAGASFDTAPYGYVLPKDQTELGGAIAEALKQLKADGTYDAILKKWGVEGGALNTFEVNPKI